jgi:hypothetical protein
MGCPAIVAILLVGWAGLARADGETEQAVSVDLGWSMFSTVGKAKSGMEPPTLTPDWGAGLGLAYERAVGTDLSLRAEAAGSLFRGGIQDPKKQSETSYALLADAGIAFRFDVLKYVPYAYGGLGAVLAWGGPIARDDASFVVVVGGGLDILTTRAKSWGIEGRFASFGGDITILTLGVRGTTRWGWF